MRRGIKRFGLETARRLGLFDVLARSRWRQDRIAVLCYHGVSLADEHRWRPALFVRAAFLRRRLELLREGGYTVLGLQDALERHEAGSLPPRSVVLTFDDGTYDFYAVAWPILQEFGYPATVYWTTYYAVRRFPVFGVAFAYAQWKAGGRLPPVPESLKAAGGVEKDAWLRSVCEAGGVPYEIFEEQRVLTIMRPAEVAELAGAGCDIQLHTHRHRMPLDEQAFREEIATNRTIIRETTGATPRHFCYTSGKFRGRYLPWLQREGVVSATTTQPGLVARGTPRLLLPRLVDHEGLTETEFESWVSGIADVLPHRTYWRDPDAA
jgi:peptidoglycan/xylan/chitin deacetylase (PgdA/CDA1 family)